MLTKKVEITAKQNKFLSHTQCLLLSTFFEPFSLFCMDVFYFSNPNLFLPPLFWHCLFTSLISKDFIFFGFLLFLLQFPFYSFLYCQLDQAPSSRFHQFRVFGLFGHSGSVLTSRPTTPFGLFLNFWLVFLFVGSL